MFMLWQRNDIFKFGCDLTNEDVLNIFRQVRSSRGKIIKKSWGAYPSKIRELLTVFHLDNILHIVTIDKDTVIITENKHFTPLIDIVLNDRPYETVSNEVVKFTNGGFFVSNI